MDFFEKALSENLAEIYRNVSKLEENALKEGKIDLTVAEVHLVCVLSKYSEGITVSGIARLLDVTKPTATVAVGKIVKKGYAVKQSCSNDGRQVNVKLTPEGERLTHLHERCQRNVIKKLGHSFSDEERQILLRAIDKLNIYFKKENEGATDET